MVLLVLFLTGICLTSSLLRLGVLMLFESVSSFPFNEGLKPLIVDENQFMCWVEYVVSEIFVIPHFSNEVFCHRLPQTFPPLHEVVIVSPLSRLVDPDGSVGYFHKRHPISFNPFSRAISSFLFWRLTNFKWCEIVVRQISQELDCFLSFNVLDVSVLSHVKSFLQA